MVVNFYRSCIFLFFIGASIPLKVWAQAEKTSRVLYQDIFLRETPQQWLFGNRELMLRFRKSDGVWQTLEVDKLPGKLSLGNTVHQIIDCKVDNQWMVEKHGATLLRHALQIDRMRKGVSFELVYGISLVAESPKAYAYLLTCRYSLLPGKKEIKRSASLLRQGNGADTAYQKMQGFVFKLPNLVLGNVSDCVLDVPGPFFPKTFLRPETPLETLKGQTIRFHSAPDAGLGILAISNHKLQASLAAWMETKGEAAYFPSISSDGKQIQFSFTNDRSYRLFPNMTVESDIQHMEIGTSLPNVLTAHRRMCEGQMPLDPQTPPSMQEMVLLEIYPDYFPDGFKGITKRLPFYKDIGFTTIYLMPHWKGGYSPIDFYEVEPKYGTADDLKETVRTAHALGMKFFFDMVIHGFNEKSPVIKQRPDIFVKDEKGKLALHPTWKSVTTDWASPAYQQYMAEVALHHTKIYDIDGYRLDAATYKGPSWDPSLSYPAYRSGSAAPELMEQMLQAMHTIKPDAVMLSEVFGPVFYTVSNLVHDNQAESAQLVLEKMEAGVYTAHDYKLHMRNVLLALPKGANRVYYTRNHDTSWFFHFNGYTPRFMAMEAIHTLCAIPEIFAGDPKNTPNPDDDKATYSYYQKLFSLRNDFPELAKGELLLQEVESDNPMVFTALRELDGKRSLVSVSMADKEETVSIIIAAPAGGAAEMPLKVNLIDGITRQPVKYELKGNSLMLKLKPYQILVGRW